MHALSRFLLLARGEERRPLLAALIAIVASAAAFSGTPAAAASVAAGGAAGKSAGTAPATPGGKGARTAAPVASDAWIAEAPPGAPHNAAYLTLRNGPRADVLEAIESPVCAVAELHAMQQSGGLLRMRREPALALAPGAIVTLLPGGRHIMLIDMKRQLATGEKVPLTLRFRKAGAVTVQAEVRPRGGDDAASDGHAHHHH